MRERERVCVCVWRGTREMIVYFFIPFLIFFICSLYAFSLRCSGLQHITHIVNATDVCDMPFKSDRSISVGRPSPHFFFWLVYCYTISILPKGFPPSPEITHFLFSYNHPPPPPLFFLASFLLQYMQCPLDDHHLENIQKYFEEFLLFVQVAQKSHGRVLVHCQQGMRCYIWGVKAFIERRHCFLASNSTHTLTHKQTYIYMHSHTH